jgi:uncharacterized protein with PIN domain
MSESKMTKGCACTQNLQDLLRAAAPKKDLIRKATCPDCGKIFWTHSDNDYCFDCQANKRQS